MSTTLLSLLLNPHPKVTIIINYDIPDEKDESTGQFRTSTTSYLQRGGRSTRGGSKGVLITLCDDDRDINDVRSIERHFFGPVEPNSVIKLIDPADDGSFETDNLNALIKESLE